MINLLNLYELNKKEQLGKGADFIVYPVKNHPDKIVKQLSNPENMEDKYFEEYIKYFQKNPHLTAKLYKYSISKKWMVLEKLNTEKFKKDIEEALLYAKNKYPDIYEKYLGSGEFTIDMVDDISTHLYYALKENNIIFVNTLLYITGQKSVLLDLVNLLKQVIFKQDRKYIDVHNNNIGYDSKNKLKFLDI